MPDYHLTHLFFIKNWWSTIIKLANYYFILPRDYKSVSNQVLSGYFTAYLLHPVATHLPEYQDCRIEHTGFFMQKVNTAFGFQKGSPLVEIFNMGLLKMLEKGLMRKLYEKHGFVKAEENKCKGPRRGKQLGFENILVLFIVLGLGTLISFLILSVEKMIFCQAKPSPSSSSAGWFR